MINYLRVLSKILCEENKNYKIILIINRPEESITSMAIQINN